jgi:hypothetical protein
VLAVILILFAAGLSQSARQSSHRLPEYAMPCVAGWWPLGNVAIEISDGSARAACLSLPQGAVASQQGTRWAELDLARFDRDTACVSSLPSSRVRVEQWQSGKAPQPSSTQPAWGSDFPDYLRFRSGTSGTEMFAPRDSSSGLRTVSCVIGADKCWAAARDGLLLVKWSTQRQRLAGGLEQDWSCVRHVLQTARMD